MIRIALISDLHIGPTEWHEGVRRKLTEHSERFLAEFAERVSTSGDYAFAVQLGDLIEDVDPETDRRNYRRGLELLEGCGVPVHHVIGNHDDDGLSREELRRMLGRDALAYSFDEDGFHFVFLHSTARTQAPGIVVPDDQVEWLEADLRRTPHPAVVFVHHSLADLDLTGNPWFEGRPDDCLVRNRREVRRILAGSGKVVGVLGGHLHWNSARRHDGIPYITVQSAIELLDDRGVPANAWGEMTLEPGRLRVEIFGDDPAEHHHEFEV